MRAPCLVTLVAASMLGAACASHADNVCQDIGDCSQRGDNDWIASCQANAKDLGTEAANTGCSGSYDQYYACADSSYSCQGDTATFPGCDQALAALDSCLAAATADTHCAMLVSAEAACAPATPPDAGPPAACTAARDCQAGCYLSAVANPCAPGADELQNVTACADTCPP